MGAHFKKNWSWYLVIILLSVGNIYFYAGKKWSERQAKIQLDEAEIECNDKIATVAEQTHMEEIKRQSTFYAFLIREQVYSESWSELRKQLENVVRETMVTQIDYVLASGKIKVSTDERIEGDNVNKDLPSNLLSENTAVHVQKTTEGYTLSVPIYEKNIYLGRLLMQHSLLTANISPK